MRKILAILFMSMFLISLAAAFEFDNAISDYDEATETLTFRNGCLFDIGWTCVGDEVGKVQLKTPKNFEVGRGYNYVWEMDAWGVDEDYNDFLKGFEFEDLNNHKEKVNRDIDIKIFMGMKNISEDTYGCIKEGTTENKTFGCIDYGVNGSRLKEVEDWKKVTPADLKKADGKVTLRGYTNVQKGDKIDWSPLIFGVRVGHDIWATWTEDLNVDILGYWNLDQSTSPSIDGLGLHSLTDVNTPTYNQGGILLKSVDFDGTGEGAGDVLYNNTNLGAGTQFTFNAWINANSSQQVEVGIVSFSNNGTGAPFATIGMSSHTKLTITLRDDALTLSRYSSTIDANNGSWIMVTGTFDINNDLISLWVNGVNIGNSTTNIGTTTLNQFSIGAICNGGGGTSCSIIQQWPFTDLIDEVGVWDRILIADEIIQLYNGGLAITYTDSFNQPPTIILNSPADDANITAMPLNLVASATDAVKVDNVTLYIDGALNTTNTSGVNGTYTFPVTLNIGVHNWSILAWNNNSLSNQSATRTFNFTGLAPVISLTTPANDSSLTSASVDMIASVTDDNGIANVTLYVDGTANETNTSQYNGTYTFTKTFAEGVHNWSLLAYDTDGLSTQSATRIFNYTQPPIFIDLLSPTDASTSQVAEVNVSCKAYEDAGVTQLNLTIDGVVNKTVTNSTVAQNLTLEQVTNFAEGNYTWGCSAINPTISAVSANRTFQVSYSSPVVVLLTPANDSSFAVSEITITFNATDINGIDNVKLYINGVLNETNSSGVKGDYSYTKNFSEGNYTWSVLATSILSKETQAANKTFEILFTSPTVTLTLPANASTFLDSNITFTFTATDAYGIKNITLFLDGVVNKTNSSGVNGSYTYDINFSGGSHNWTVRAASIKDKITNSKRTFFIHTTAPTVTITEPSGRLGYFLLGNNQTLTYNISEVGENSSHFNTCWYEYGLDITSFESGYNGWSTSGTVSLSEDWSTLGSKSAKFVGGGIFGGSIAYINKTMEEDGYLEFDINFASGTFNPSFYILNSTSVVTGNCDNCSYILNASTDTGIHTNQLINFSKGDNIFLIAYNEATVYLDNLRTYSEKVIINCSETETNFTYQDGENSITVFAEDTYGLTGSSTSTWTYDFLEINQTYNSTTVETSEEDYIMVGKYNNSDWSSILAWINYNGTLSQALFTGVSDIATTTRTLFIDSIVGTTTKTFNWTIQFTNATGSYNYTSSNQNQSITKVNFTVCPYSSTPQLFFQTYSVSAPTTALNATFASAWLIKNAVGGNVELNKSYEDTTELNSSWGFCIQPNSTTYKLSVDVTVNAVNYTAVSHYIVDIDYTGATQNISLYLLADNASTLTQLEVTDGNYNPIEGAYITIERYDVGTDTYYTVAMAKTDSTGTDLVYLTWYEDWYRFSVVVDGVVELVDGPRKVSETPVSFKIDDPYTSDYEKFRDISYGLTYNNATKNFVLSYVTTTGGVSTVCLRTIKRNVTNDYIICDTCETSTSATIYCNIAAYGNGTFIGLFYATGSPPYYIDWLYEYVNVNALIYDAIGNDNGTGLAILIAGVVLSMFLITPALGVFGMILGMLLVFALGFQPFETISFLGIVIVGGLIMWAVQK